MVQEPTLAVAHTGQCAGIWSMACVFSVRDTRHGIWHREWTCGRTPRENIPGHLPHDMAYGVGNGCAGVRQGGMFLDICPVVGKLDR